MSTSRVALTFNKKSSRQLLTSATVVLLRVAPACTLLLLGIMIARLLRGLSLLTL